MPKYDTAPVSALSLDQIIRWLDQVANDRSLSPVACRAAVKLAASFASGEASIVLRNADMAAILNVAHNTGVSALAKLRQHGHLEAHGRPGHPLAYSPILRGEA